MKKELRGYSVWAKPQTPLALVILTLAIILLCSLPFLLASCSAAGFLDGEIVVADRDLPCWQCPGGVDTKDCQNQSSWGTIPEGTKLTVRVETLENLPMAGFIRVETPILTSVNPTDNSTVEIDGRVCWVDSSGVSP